MPFAFISVGSNIDPERNIKKALIMLCGMVSIKKISTFYKTVPIGRPEQDEYYNGVLLIETEASPHYLKFMILKNIENGLGRIRMEDKYASRIIDLDVILYDREIIHSNNMDIPDPEIIERPFLAYPVLELAPELIIPELEKPIAELAENLEKKDMLPLIKYTEKLRRIIKNGR